MFNINDSKLTSTSSDIPPQEKECVKKENKLDDVISQLMQVQDGSIGFEHSNKKIFSHKLIILGQDLSSKNSQLTELVHTFIIEKNDTENKELTIVEAQGRDVLTYTRSTLTYVDFLKKITNEGTKGLSFINLEEKERKYITLFSKIAVPENGKHKESMYSRGAAVRSLFGRVNFGDNAKKRLISNTLYLFFEEKWMKNSLGQERKGMCSSFAGYIVQCSLFLSHLETKNPTIFSQLLEIKNSQILSPEQKNAQAKEILEKFIQENDITESFHFDPKYVMPSTLYQILFSKNTPVV